jgi:hypothetical protein
VYLALYGPEGLVIFDHPYNAEYLRFSALGCYCPGGKRRSASSGRLRQDPGIYRAALLTR